MASCTEEIYLKALAKQASWTYVKLIIEFSGYQLILICFGSPKVLRRQMLDIKCK